MFNKLVISALFLVLLPNLNNAQSLNNLKEINLIWEKFYQAFDSLDYKPMAEIHSKDLVRVSGGKRILDYETYINNYKTRFKKAKDNSISNKISLRFSERINNGFIASEKGIYKLIRIDSLGNKKTYYGQFLVVFKKEHGLWKILMDYDSNENNTIGEKDYVKAHSINELDKFVQD